MTDRTDKDQAAKATPAATAVPVPVSATPVAASPPGGPILFADKPVPAPSSPSLVAEGAPSAPSVPSAVGEGEGAAGAHPDDWIIDTTTETFAADVTEASFARPVLLDCWATWCEPCKQLTPALEKVVREAHGAVLLAKLDIDRNRELATELQIQSVPTVYVFFQGQVVNGFQGAVPESQLRQLVDRIVEATGAKPQEADPVAILFEEAEAARKEGQLDSAAELFLSARDQEPEGPRVGEAALGYALCLLEAKKLDPLRAFLETLTEAVREGDAFEPVRAGLELAAVQADAALLEQLTAAVKKNPKDWESRFAAAHELHAAGERQAAAEQLLEIVRYNPKWNDQAPRKELLKYFAAWGDDDPLTLEVRQQLSSLLFS